MSLTHTRKQSNAPESLTIGGEHHVKINTWREVLSETAHWLVDKGKITADYCPVYLPRAKRRVLIDHKPRHPTGREFFNTVALKNGLYLEGHGSGPSLFESAAWLLSKFGYTGALSIQPPIDELY